MCRFPSIYTIVISILCVSIDAFSTQILHRASSARDVEHKATATVAGTPSGIMEPVEVSAESGGDDTAEKSWSLSPTERARTVAQTCISGTLCTLAEGEAAMPFGSHVDYILDSNGSPVMLLSDQSLHTTNLKRDPSATLFSQMDPETQGGVPRAAMSRVSLIGKVLPITDKDQELECRTLYSVTHPYIPAKVYDSPGFSFYKLEPEKIYYVGGFGVSSEWVEVSAFEEARSDLLALESNELANKLNKEKNVDLLRVSNQFLTPGTSNIVVARIVAIDRLGMDMRVTCDKDRTSEYRLGFVAKIFSLEDAKSEVCKIFQEAWEKEQGYEWEDMGPPVVKTAEEILK